MQHYDVSTTKRKVRLAVVYTVMTLLVVLISGLCLLLALGYRFDFATHRVEQGALLQLASSPSNARVTLDGEELSFTTSGKRDIAVGSHSVTLRKDGYRDWNKKFTVKAGEVRWLNYARLVPTTVDTRSVVEFRGLASELPAPNHRFFALLVKADTPELTVVDVSDAKKVKTTTITVPENLLGKAAGAASTYKVFEWHAGSKYVLLQHDYGTNREYLRVNVETPTDVVNISTKFGVPLSDVHFADTGVFYGVENGNLRRFDLGASSLSEPLVKDVVAMQLYGNSDLAYVRHANSRYEVGVVVGGTVHAVTSYDETAIPLVDLSKYFNERYLAVGRGASFELIKNPEKTAEDGMKKVVTLTSANDIKWLDLSNNGRFAVAGNGMQFLTYDIELAADSRTNFPNMQPDPTTRPQWLDDYLLVSSADNKLRLSDFDGDNQQIVADSLPSRPVMLSDDGMLLYSFSKTQSSTAVALQVSTLILP